MTVTGWYPFTGLYILTLISKAPCSTRHWTKKTSLSLSLKWNDIASCYSLMMLTFPCKFSVFCGAKVWIMNTDLLGGLDALLLTGRLCPRSARSEAALICRLFTDFNAIWIQSHLPQKTLHGTLWINAFHVHTKVGKWWWVLNWLWGNWATTPSSIIPNETHHNYGPYPLKISSVSHPGVKNSKIILKLHPFLEL